MAQERRGGGPGSLPQMRSAGCGRSGSALASADGADGAAAGATTAEWSSAGDWSAERFMQQGGGAWRPREDPADACARQPGMAAAGPAQTARQPMEKKYAAAATDAMSLRIATNEL